MVPGSLLRFCEGWVVSRCWWHVPVRRYGWYRCRQDGGGCARGAEADGGLESVVARRVCERWGWVCVLTTKRPALLKYAEQAVFATHPEQTRGIRSDAQHTFQSRSEHNKKPRRGNRSGAIIQYRAS